MTPDEKRIKLRELNERARQHRLDNIEPARIVLVLYNGRLIDMPEDVAKKYDLPYFLS